MKKVVTKAIVLGRLHYGEADKIVTLLTPDYGKVSVVAKGVRKSKSRAAGGIELFTVSEISFIESTKELKTLVSARAGVFYGNILKDLPTTKVAYELLQITNSFTESACESAYFIVLEHALHSLNEGAAPIVIGVWFAVQVLALSGHAINTVIEGHATIFDFSLQDMEFIPSTNGPFAQNHIKVLRLLVELPVSKVLLVHNIQQYAEELQPLLRQLTKIYSTKNL